MKLKLRYFDFDGGRGEPARLALAIGEIPFEDDRIPLASWPSVREQMPFRAVPVLEVDGEAITQSNTINRFVGRLAGLYPEEPLEAARCDEVMDAVEDVVTQLVPTFRMQDDAEKRAAREALAKGPIPLYLAKLDQMLVRRGAAHFADGRLTVADLKVFVWIENLCSGVLDYIPTSLAAQEGPHLVEQHGRLGRLPAIAGYYGKRRAG